MYNPELTASQYIHVSGISGINNEEQIQIPNIKLGNYPNPFNPSTTISFNLTTNLYELVQIEIYNVRGQLVDEIEIGNKQSSVNWNAEEFTSGIYLYKLNINNSPIKKMILLK